MRLGQLVLIGDLGTVLFSWVCVFAFFFFECSRSLVVFPNRNTVWHPKLRDKPRV